METASRSMPAAFAMSDAALDVLLWPFLAEAAVVDTAGGDGLRGGVTAGVSIARRTSPATRGTSEVMTDGAAWVWVMVVDMVRVQTRSTIVSKWLEWSCDCCTRDAES